MTNSNEILIMEDIALTLNEKSVILILLNALIGTTHCDLCYRELLDAVKQRVEQL